MSKNHNSNKAEISCHSSTKLSTKSNNNLNGGGGKFAEIFSQFQQKIDARNDKWERLVKLSRDVTIESKRIIFLLHRVTTAQQQTNFDENDSATTTTNKIFQEAEDRFEILKQSKFFHIAQELRDEDPHQFSHPIKPGMQEFIEALSFYHFLKFDRLIDFKQVRKFFNFEAKECNDDRVHPQIIVSGEDYLSGIGDLSGELMRLAINYISAGDFEKPCRIVDFLRQLYNHFSSISRADVGNFYSKKNLNSHTLREKV
uniref:Translin-associated protein X-like protein n=1 Tax=Romanomermis culicivorax TaxID=13658 RepID=A0A915I005_ROMCU